MKVPFFVFNNEKLIFGVKLTDLSSSNTAVTIGTIIAVHAVFDIHIERNIVVSIKPNISLKLKKNGKSFGQSTQSLT